MLKLSWLLSLTLSVSLCVSHCVVFAVTCVWSCVASKRWTAAQWPAPCLGSTWTIPRPGRSFWCSHRRPKGHHLTQCTQSACAHTHSCAQTTDPQPHFQQKSTKKPLDAEAGSCYLYLSSGSPPETSGSWISVLWINTTRDTKLTALVPSWDVLWIYSNTLVQFTTVTVHLMFLYVKSAVAIVKNFSYLLFQYLNFTCVEYFSSVSFTYVSYFIICPKKVKRQILFFFLIRNLRGLIQTISSYIIYTACYKIYLLIYY